MPRSPSLEELLELIKSKVTFGAVTEAELTSLLKAKIPLNRTLGTPSVLKMIREYISVKTMCYHGLITDHDGTLIPIDKRDADMPKNILAPQWITFKWKISCCH